MDDVTPPPAAHPEGPAPPADRTGGLSRWWSVGAVVAVAAFAATVVLSTASSSRPRDPQTSMAGMRMSTSGRLSFTGRDTNSRPVLVPDARAGIIVLARARRCAPCVAAVRAASHVLSAGTGHAQLIVLMTDAAAGDRDVATFARAVGASPARYLTSDHDATITLMLRSSMPGDAAVYDASGRIVSYPHADTRALTAALQQARR